MEASEMAVLAVVGGGEDSEEEAPPDVQSLQYQ